jgi:hypothetical protein
MAKYSQESAAHIDGVLSAWEKLRPEKRFYGISLEDFRNTLRPFMNSRTEVADLEKRLQHAMAERDLTHNEALKTMQGVIDGVKGDPEEGSNGALYSAMGYVPKSQRSTGLKRPRKESPPSQQAHVPGAATALSPAKEGAQ